MDLESLAKELHREINSDNINPDNINPDNYLNHKGDNKN
jgi:hypothetical protein